MWRRSIRGAATRRVHGGRGFGIGLEQQLYHTERRAPGGSVVQGLLPVLCGRVYRCCKTIDHKGQQGSQGRAARAAPQRQWQHGGRRVDLTARLSHSGGGFWVGVEQQLYHINRRALRGCVVQGHLRFLCTRRVVQHCGV